MYDQNTLMQQLRAGSLGAETKVFARQQGRIDLPYGSLFEAAEQMAAGLVALGVQPGSRVAVQAEKSIEMIELYLGTVLAGAVFLPLNPAYTAAEIAYFLEDASPDVFVCDPVRLAEMEPVATSFGIAQVKTLGADGFGSWRGWITGFEPGFQAVPRAPEDLAAILYTSGTTGRSKGAMLSHRALASNSQALKAHWRFTADDVLIHALPIYHTHGLFVATNIALMAGSSLIFMTKFDADAIVATMKEATSLMGVPTFYTRLLDHEGLTAEAVAGMRLFVSGSAPLLESTHEDWQARTGHAILERYGMTETNMNTSNPYDGARRSGTVGFALPGIEMRLVDADGAPVRHGSVGAIEVRGDNVFSGYWNMPEKTAQDMRTDGWFITGDLGVLDADGYLSIVGRSKDLIITGGLNVYPREIERVIDDLPGVLESAVIGVAHGDLGETVVAIVVPDGTRPLESDSVMSGLGEKLARFKQPKAVFVVEALPRNAMGKVQKNLLRQTYQSSLSGSS